MTIRCWLPGLVVGLGIAGATASAHELKVFSSRSTLPEKGGKATVYLCEGHRVPVNELLEAESIQRFELVAPGGAKSLLQTGGVSIQANVVNLTEPGVYTVAASRKPTIWTYVLDDQGERKLTRGTKLDHRAKKIETATRYSEFAKTLIVVGKAGGAAPRPVGLMAEIVPLDGPADWRSNRDIRFQLVEDRKPVPFAPWSPAPSASSPTTPGTTRPRRTRRGNSPSGRIEPASGSSASNTAN